MVVLAGVNVAKILGITNEEQVQPNGVDLRLRAIYSFPTSTYEFNVNDKEDEAIPLRLKGRVFEIGRGAYLVSLMERITIPRDCVGLALPRSTLLRHGLDLRTALWDSGYQGQGRCLLVSYREKARLAKGSRIAQMIFMRTQGIKRVYKGQYQGEE